jgi:hypothetical protein
MIGHFQILIFKLYTNEELRQSFATSPKEIFEKYDLTTKEKEALTGIAKDQLNMFAESLSKKRLGMAKRALAKNPEAVVGSAFYISNPVMFFQTGNIVFENLPENLYKIFRHVNGKINIGSLFRAFFATDGINTRDCLRFFRIIQKNNLMGKQAMIL